MHLNSSEMHARASWKRLFISIKKGFHRKTIIFLPIIVVSFRVVQVGLC